jgi:hypothetical protein
MVSSVSLHRLGFAFFCLLPFVHARDAVSSDLNAYGASSQSPYQSFVSAPDLKPPELLFTKNEAGISDGYLFIGVNGKPGSTQNVPSIYGGAQSKEQRRIKIKYQPCPADMSPGPRLGTLVWTGIDYKEPFDFKVQTYKGQPHLTFFLGTLLNGMLRYVENSLCKRYLTSDIQVSATALSIS